MNPSLSLTSRVRAAQIRPSMFKEKVSPLEKRVDALSEEMRANFASLQEQLGAIQKAMSA